MAQKSLFKSTKPMKKEYNRALVIGKFQPLHKGHLSLIDFAISKSERVDVCATAHDGELIPLKYRVSWLVDSYKEREEVTIHGISYDPTMLNESSVSDIKSSEEWADFLRDNVDGFSDIDVIIGSEMYVKYMADYLGISYVIYDQKRENIHISATDIKGDIIRYWDYLAPATKRHYVKHICICGSESSGKSTVCKRLEEEYNFVTMIPEIGRCLVGKSEICEVSTLEKIFKIHNDLLEAVIFDPPTPIILWDTDNIITLSYYTFLFPDRHLQDLKLSREVYKADKYFFFESNIPFHDDGTRFDSAEAMRLRNHHVSMYRAFNVDLETVVSMERCEIVRAYILKVVERLKVAFVNGNAMSDL